ncbi:unnamed protein product [Orchesella dallaii]|uniref:Elongation of very long chain fatty acids protein n=1 Tax=Orchesella dallaii TaxID=48710 RepID=A0ABP1Q866_9HEXA
MAYNITSDPYFQDLIKRKPFGYPVIENPYFKSFEFEKVDFFWWHKYASDNWKLPFYAGAVYIVAIFGIQKLMKNRPAFELKYPLFLWNLSIGVLSIIGFIRAFPEFWKEISARNGLYSSICIRNGFDVPTTYWLLAFILSKYLELGDTIFIVLRKRPLIFLQWYHHLVTLIVTWIVGKKIMPCIPSNFHRASKMNEHLRQFKFVSYICIYLFYFILFYYIILYIGMYFSSFS